MKKQTNFRLSEQAMTNLAELMDRWGCSRTEVVERAMASAAQHDDEHTSHVSAAPPQDKRRSEEADQGRPVETASTAPYSARRIEEGAKRPNFIDRDKIAAAQHLHGMDKAPKRS